MRGSPSLTMRSTTVRAMRLERQIPTVGTLPAAMCSHIVRSPMFSRRAASSARSRSVRVLAVEAPLRRRVFCMGAVFCDRSRQGAGPCPRVPGDDLLSANSNHRPPAFSGIENVEWSGRAP